MTEARFDSLLVEALYVAADREGRRAAARLREAPIPYTSEFAVRMRRLYEDPFGYGKRLARPRWQRAARGVAAAVLAAALLLGAALAVSPSFRAWLVRQYKEYVDYVFQSTDGPPPGGYTGATLPADVRPQFIPEGYVEQEATAFAGVVSVTYRTESGKKLKFTYMTMEEGGAFGTDSEDYRLYEMERNGYRVLVGEPEEPERKPAYVIWSDPGLFVSFRLSGHVELDTLFTIFDSVPTNF